MTEYVGFMANVRTRRNELLEESDWAVMPDSPLSDSKKAEWVTYRQALRDLPKNGKPSSDDDPSDWSDIVEGDGHWEEDKDWPKKPS